jgi:hypothetical protein
MKITKEILSEMYLVNKMSTRSIAKFTGTNQTKIVDMMKEYGIKARPKTENKMPVKKGEKIPWDLKNHTKKSNLKRSLKLKNKFYFHKSENYHPSVAVTCVTCGDVFKKKYSYWIKNKTGNFYCSDKCNPTFIKTGAKPWNYGKTNPLLDFNCPECSKLFQVRQLSGERKLPEKIYCSPKCALPHLSEGVVFKSRSKYKYSPYYGPEWVTIKKVVMVEEPCCNVCCSISESDIDHIRAFDTFNNHLEANNRTNLWKICDRCHGIKTRYEDKVGIQIKEWWINFIKQMIQDKL